MSAPSFSQAPLGSYIPWPADPLRALGLASVYGLAFFAPFSIALGQIAQALMLLLAIAFLYRHWAHLKTSPLIWLTGAYILYVLGRGAVAALIEAPFMEPSQWPEKMDAPNLATAHWDETVRWLRSGPVAILLAAVALVATGNWLRHSLGALVAMLVGFGVMLAEGFDPGRLGAALLGGSRYHEGVNLFIDALKLATVALGLFAFSPSLLKYRGSFWGLALRWAGWLTLLGGAIAGIVAMQTRSVWLAGMIGLLALGVAAAWSTRDQWWTAHRRSALTLGLVGLVLVTGINTFFAATITERWNAGGAGATLQQALSTPPTEWGEKLPDNSVGIRAAYFAVALDLYVEKPILGYGPADPRYLQQNYPHLPTKLKDKGGHFHNTHLEFLLSFGLLGYALLALTFLAALTEARNQIREGGIGRMLGLFVVAVTVTLVVFGFTTVNFERFKLAHFYGLILGTLWAAHVARRAKASLENPGQAPAANSTELPGTPVGAG